MLGRAEAKETVEDVGTEAGGEGQLRKVWRVCAEGGEREEASVGTACSELLLSTQLHIPTVCHTPASILFIPRASHHQHHHHHYHRHPLHHP